MSLKQIIKACMPSFCISFVSQIKNKISVRKLLLIQKNYKKIERKLAKKINDGKKLSVGFYVIYDSSWGARPLFEKLLRDERYVVKIVVCPDIARGNDNLFKNLNDTYSRLVNLYGNEFVLKSYNDEISDYVDYSSLFDIISFENPYDIMTMEYYKISYAIKKGKLTFFNSYAYQGKLKYDERFLMPSYEYSLFWKLFVDNKESFIHALDNQIIKGGNAVLSGCCKMDKFHNEDRTDCEFDKTILIAPHHTVEINKGSLHISNFLQYSELFLELPKLYPSIKFIFRPHPLLIPTLSKDEVWGKDKTESYMQKMLSNLNVEYSYKGEYFDDFNRSDAMIDDCGSFLAEYFYTKKPQCYMIKNRDSLESEFSEFGKEMLSYVYCAYKKDDIINFIEEVVLKNNDDLKNFRCEYSTNHIMINYPKVSDFISDFCYKQIMESK